MQKGRHEIKVRKMMEHVRHLSGSEGSPGSGFALPGMSDSHEASSLLLRVLSCLPIVVFVFMTMARMSFRPLQPQFALTAECFLSGSF